MTQLPSELGPFAPPTEYEFESELVGEIPRPIPSYARRGRYGRRRRMVVLIIAWIGALSLLLGQLPFVQAIGKHFLPFEYLRCIGWGAVILDGCLFVAGYFIQGNYRYIREGVPLIARVRSLSWAPRVHVNDVPTQHKLLATIEFCDPRSGELRTAYAKPFQFIPIDRAEPSDELELVLVCNIIAGLHGNVDDYTTSFRVGEYVTAVYLPRDLDRSLRLYGFLDLVPEIGLVRRPGRDARRASLWAISVMTVVLSELLLMPHLILLAIEFSPLRFGFDEALIPFAAGAGGIWGVLLLARSFSSFRRKLSPRIDNIPVAVLANKPSASSARFATIRSKFQLWRSRLAVLLGAGLIGGVPTVCCCIIANAVLDRSLPRMRPVKVSEMVVETRAFVMRDYQIRYKFAGDREIHWLSTTLEHIASFRGNDGIAEIHSGSLGWVWVKTIHPVRPLRGK